VKILESIRKFFIGGSDEPKVQVVAKVANPINAKIGQMLLIDVLDYRNQNISIFAINEFKLGTAVAVDYDLLVNTLGSEYKAKLRLVGDVTRDLGFRAYILLEYDRLPSDKGLYAVVQDTKQSLQANDKNGSSEEFKRVKGSPSFFSAKVRRLTDKDKDGSVTEDEVEHSSMKLWDYYHDAVIEGVACQETLFVEMDDESRGFVLWKGVDVDAEDISTI
jgi:hypothetical protein